MLIKRVSLSAHGAEPGGAILRLADISARRNAEQAREEALEFLSHDMRAPQAAILTLLEAAEANPAAPFPLERLRAYAAHALKLADDFVELARLATLTPQRALVDLAGVFEEAIDGVYASARAKCVTVALDAPGSLPPIAADPWLLIRAIGNLLDNAVKYSPAGAIVRCSLSVAAGATATDLTIIGMIADSGPGIPAERLAGLFKRFGSKDIAMVRSAGLGLAFASRAVSLMGGTITCESSSAGTTFCLKFPAQDLSGWTGPPE
jgi:signal transduction histidine kinase